MTEQLCPCGDVELCYETFGDPDNPAILLIMGLGCQMVAWHRDLCELFVAEGFHVIRFDNRDCGRSTHFTHVRAPTPWELLRRDPRVAGYTLDDMADDTAMLLEQLGREAAHVVGVSMGGMIAQVLATRHPEKVLSLTSMMASTGARRSGQPALRMYRVFMSRRSANREQAIERVVRVFRLIGSPGFPRDEDDLREIASLSLDRARGDGAGSARQLAAIIASGDRTASLASVRAPTLVIHGTADRLVRPSGGKATAAAIPGARLELIDGLGHDLPRALWPRLVATITEHARAAQAAVIHN